MDVFAQLQAERLASPLPNPLVISELKAMLKIYDYETIRQWLDDIHAEQVAQSAIADHFTTQQQEKINEALRN